MKDLTYAVRFADGTYYSSTAFYKGVPIGAARFFAKRGSARAIANKKWHASMGAKVVAFELTEVSAE